MKNNRVCRLVIRTSDPERRRGGLPPSSPASQHGLRLKTQATSSDTDTREVAETHPRRIDHRDDHDHEHDDAKGADERVGAGSGRNGKHSSVLLTSAFTDVGGMAQRHVQCGPKRTRDAANTQAQPVRLEFVVRRRLGAGRGPCSGRPSARGSDRQWSSGVDRRKSPACVPSMTRGSVLRCR